MQPPPPLERRRSRIPPLHADPVTTTASSKEADKTIPPHPLADIFPPLDEDGLRALAEDIRTNGLREDIVLYQGKILDGRCRYRACEIAGVVPGVTQYAGDNPLAFVVSHNLHRRHLNESQRAMVAARLADLHRGANQHSAGLPIGSAAKIFSVSERSIARAKEVLRDGGPELLEDVTSGRITVSAAINRLRRKSPSNKTLTGRGLSAKATPPTSTVPSASADTGKGLGLPRILDRRDPEEVFASLKAAWANSPGLVAAWEDAPLAIRERFISAVLRGPSYRRPIHVELIRRRTNRGSKS